MAPKTVLDKVIAAIRACDGPKGASRQTIVKYLKSEFGLDNAAHIKKALKSDKLVQTGQSFRVKGDAPIAPPADEVCGIEDVVVGDGPAAEKGDEVAMQYVGTLEDGHRFDAGNWFTFTLGAGDVIKGWDQAIVGMKVGGRRKLVVPPKLGYGAKGSSPDIPPNATLLFDVTLKQILE
mmetsp:Transcript_10662/g.31785  ORF Transcript_10662/g.31785 Transcript_10662/m.31785 type:complete len:178 (-) Transcript_10662:27-560(-)